MPSTCEFQFNNPNGVYYSGDTISGTITLTTTSPKNVRDITINFVGEGKVRWEETERRKNSNGVYEDHTVVHTSNEVYVNNTTVVMGPGTLEVGTHTYEFQIQLPLECPTSCEGEYGHIRYEITLKLDRKMSFDNKFSQPLSVIRKQDLNLNPTYKFPVGSENIFSAGCFSCSGGKLSATLEVPFGGYAIGQRVKYFIRLENQLMDDVEGYEIEFERKMTFTAHTPDHETREVKNVLYYRSCDDARCLRLTNRIFKGSFEIESTPPTTEGENIIDVEYNIKVELRMSGCSPDRSLELPLFVGTVPVVESIVPPSPLDFGPNESLITVVATAPDLDDSDAPTPPPNYQSLAPAYQSLAPPSFEEAIRRGSAPFVDTDKDVHNRHIGFRPLYPMYSQTDEEPV